MLARGDLKQDVDAVVRSVGKDSRDHPAYIGPLRLVPQFDDPALIKIVCGDERGDRRELRRTIHVAQAIKLVAERGACQRHADDRRDNRPSERFEIDHRIL